MLDAATFARGAARLINLGRNEHVVFHPDGSRRAYKVTRAGEYGARGGVADYLERLEVSNRLFADDYRLIGAVRDAAQGRLRLVISQPWIARARAGQRGEIEAYFRAIGFLRYSDRSFYHPGLEMLVSDAEGVNVVVDPRGWVAPIDVIPYRVPSSRAEMYENVVRQRAG